MNQTHPHDNKPLIQKATKGDRAAFDALYRLYYPSLYRFISQLVEDGRAEDIASEVFCSMLEGKASFTSTGQATFFTWLCAVARNQVISDYRKARYSSSAAEFDEDSLDRLMGGTPSAGHRLEMQQDAEAIRYCISKLPVEQRVPLVLTSWKGATLAEIAAEMACPEGTIKSRLYAARASLQQCVNKWIFGGRYGKSI